MSPRKALQINGTTRDTSFFIVKKGCQALIGLNACVDFGIVPASIDSVRCSGNAGPVEEFAHLFHGTGCVQRKYKMVLRPDAIPVVQPARRVPVALKKPLRDELARMEKPSIIAKVEEPTEWVSPLVLVRKTIGALRVCMDPREVNKIYCVNTTRCLFAKTESEFSGARLFSRLDANSCFHQIPLDEATARICTFATPLGRYRFLRLPFGISSASEFFQKTLTQICEGIPRVRVYVDDVLLSGADKVQHDERLRIVLKRTEEAGLAFNPEKRSFGKKELTFLGDTLSEGGVRASPELIESVRAMLAPKAKVQ